MHLRSCSLLVFFIVLTETAGQKASTAAVQCGEKAVPCATPTDANCEGCVEGDLVVDPFECHQYHMCDGASSLAFDGISFTCPDGQVFDPTDRKCIAGDSCTSQCNSGNCLYTCSVSSEPAYVADPDDCSVYYECSGVDIADIKACPTTEPYFDGARCQTDITKCCHCHPYCYAADINQLVADPIDCRKYHYCTAEGEPEIHGDCDPNEYFSEVLQICSATAHCTTRCKNVIGSDGCIDPYTCQATGYFAKCPTKCWEEYYQCDAISDEYIDAGTCTSGYTFHPDLLVCVKEDTCSYP